ncbi:MAG TPA: MFS transporter [Gammaproteobacteria bacterium]|nr:MFS transporter [Gammaproteobacteria bacterium]
MNHSRPLEDFFPDWAAITAVVIGITAFAVSQGLTYPLISLVLERNDVSEGLIGLNAGAFAAGLAAATLLVRRLTAIAAGDHLIIAGLFGSSVFLAFFAIFDSVWVWFIARFGLGFCVSVIFMLSEAWLNAACPNRLRGRVSGIYGAGMCAGFAAGPLAIPLFGTGSGFAFALISVYLALTAFGTAILSRRARTRPEASPAGALRRFIGGAPILVGMVLAFGFADVAAIAVMPVYFVKTGHSEAFAAISVTVLALPTALAQPLIGMLLDKISRLSVGIASGYIAASSFMLIALLQSEPAILVVFALMGTASFALYTCALTLLGERYTGGLLVAGSAVFALAYALGSAGGSTITGFAMDFFSPSAAPISAGLVLLAFTVVATLRGPQEA